MSIQPNPLAMPPFVEQRVHPQASQAGRFPSMLL